MPGRNTLEGQSEYRYAYEEDLTQHKLKEAASSFITELENRNPELLEEIATLMAKEPSTGGVNSQHQEFKNTSVPEWIQQNEEKAAQDIGRSFHDATDNMSYEERDQATTYLINDLINHLNEHIQDATKPNLEYRLSTGVVHLSDGLTYGNDQQVLYGLRQIRLFHQDLDTLQKENLAYNEIPQNDTGYSDTTPGLSQESARETPSAYHATAVGYTHKPLHEDSPSEAAKRIMEGDASDTLSHEVQERRRQALESFTNALQDYDPEIIRAVTQNTYDEFPDSLQGDVTIFQAASDASHNLLDEEKHYLAETTLALVTHQATTAAQAIRESDTHWKETKQEISIAGTNRHYTETYMALHDSNGELLSANEQTDILRDAHMEAYRLVDAKNNVPPEWDQKEMVRTSLVEQVDELNILRFGPEPEQQGLIHHIGNFFRPNYDYYPSESAHAKNISNLQPLIRMRATRRTGPQEIDQSFEETQPILPGATRNV